MYIENVPMFILIKYVILFLALFALKISDQQTMYCTVPYIRLKGLLNMQLA